jgi:hypothetical protein
MMKMNFLVKNKNKSGFLVSSLGPLVGFVTSGGIINSPPEVSIRQGSHQLANKGLFFSLGTGTPANLKTILNTIF